MLVIERKERQWFVIILPSGDEIGVSVVRIKGDKAKIGIEAPKDFVVLREELLHERSKRRANE